MFIKYSTLLGREDWSLLPSTWYCGEAPWCGSGSCRSPNSVKISQSWEILWRKAAHLFDVLFHCAPTKVSRAIHRITGCLLVALCQFHLRRICQAGAEYIHICKRAPFYRATIYFEILCLTSSRIPEKNAWDPWPPDPHSVGEKPGKVGPRGAETCGRKRRTPGKPKKLCKARCLWVRVSKIPGKGKKSSTENWNFVSSQPICHYFWVNSQTWGPFPSVQQPMLVAFAWAGKPILTSFICDKVLQGSWCNFHLL